MQRFLLAYAQKKIFKKEKFQVAKFLSKNGFTIPTAINIAKKEMKYITDSINSIVK